MKELQDQDYQQLLIQELEMFLGQQELQTLLSKDRSKQMTLNSRRSKY
jgi:hypothetical protein